jgi:hypothetical protein
MRALRTILQRAVWPRLDAGQDFSLRRAIARQRVGDQHPGHVCDALAPLSEG